MRVVFDSQIFAMQKFGGVSRYFASLVRCLSEMEDVHPSIAAPMHINDYVGDLPDRLVRGWNVGRLPAAGAISRVFNLAADPLLQSRLHPDIVHRTYYLPVLRPSGRARTVVTVYDMIHELYPQNFSRHNPIASWKAKAVSRADHVICISQRTRADLLERLDVPPEKVSVTYLCCDDLRALMTQEARSEFRTRVLGSDTPYLLYVGSRSSYKNFAALLRAYAASTGLRSSFFLLSFGGGPFSAAERAMHAELGVSDRVRQVSGADQLLAQCYRHADLFVYPSQYEGFGIPPLEAMSLDCPVACSNTSSIPEVVGDAAMAFDPNDVDSIRSALESVLSSAALLAQLVERGRQRVQLFSWRKCAAETASIYGGLLAR